MDVNGIQTPAERWHCAKPTAPWSRDGNAFAIMGCVMAALKHAGYPPAARNEYWTDCTSGDYDHLVQVSMRWCDEGDPDDAD